jgi:polo-like kinase 1
LVLDPSKRPGLEDILNDPFMSDPIPKTIPRSTLACPPAKNFTDQFTKPSGSTASNQLSQKSSNPNFERVGKKESEKDFNLKPASKEPGKAENFASSGTNFRASSKDAKQTSNKNIPYKAEPSSNKKGK